MSAGRVALRARRRCVWVVADRKAELDVAEIAVIDYLLRVLHERVTRFSAVFIYGGQHFDGVTVACEEGRWSSRLKYRNYQIENAPKT